MAEFRLETERLILRDWREDDLDALHRISRALMGRLGKRRDPGMDFEYAGPGRPEGSPPEPHVTYWLDEPR